MSRAGMISDRAAACLADIERTLSAPRLRDEDGVFADRAQILTNLRGIRQKTIEAEALLRSLDYRSPYAGIAQARAPAASTSGDAVSNPHPAPPLEEFAR